MHAEIVAVPAQPNTVASVGGAFIVAKSKRRLQISDGLCEATQVNVLILRKKNPVRAVQQCTV